MEYKSLKPYKGFMIDKFYKLKPNGTIDKETLIYTAYSEDKGLIESSISLIGLKKKIDSLVKK